MDLSVKNYPIELLELIYDFTYSKFVSVSIGFFCSSAVKNDGTIESWRNNGCKQISHTPKDSKFISVFVGVLCSSAIKDDGTIVSWGDNECKQISDTPN